MLRKKEDQEVPIITIAEPDSELVDIPQYTRYSLHHTSLRLCKTLKYHENSKKRKKKKRKRERKEKRERETKMPFGNVKKTVNFKSCFLWVVYKIAVNLRTPEGTDHKQ